MLNVGDVVSVKGRVIEVVSSEDYGVRYQVKVKANDKSVVLTFEEDEVASAAAAQPEASEP